MYLNLTTILRHYPYLEQSDSHALSMLNDALRAAAITGQSIFVNIFIENGAEVNAKNQWQDTPLGLLLLEDHLSAYTCIGNNVNAVKLATICDVLILIFDQLRQLNVHTWRHGEQQRLLAYSTTFEIILKEQQVTLGALQMARDQFYKTIREKYKCPKASDQVVASFLDHHFTLGQHLLPLNCLLAPSSDKVVSTINLPTEIRDLIMQSYIDTIEEKPIFNSHEETNNYLQLACTFFAVRKDAIKQHTPSSNELLTCKQ